MPSLDADLDALVEETDFSGVVQLLRRGESLYERAAGLADRAHGIANTLDTQFATASATKGFTALAVMGLVEDGALSLDTPVRSLLRDELELIDPAVTVEHLLAHTSGIGDYLDEDLPGDIDDYALTVPVHLLAVPHDYLAVLRGFPMKRGVGERFSYCNGGYVVLALLIEAASGRSYYDEIDRRVFAPAAMIESAFFRSDEVPGRAALGYVRSESGRRTNQLHMPARGCGDGGAYSTLADVTRFWSALLAGEIVAPTTVNEMVRPHNDAPDQSLRYGLGFWLRPDRDTVMLEGYDAGVSFRSAHDPASGVQYTVISNTSEGAWPLVRLLDDRLPDLVAG